MRSQNADKIPRKYEEIWDRNTKYRFGFGIFLVYQFFYYWLTSLVLTRAWPGGGAFNAPSRIFVIAQKRTRLSTWNLANLLIQQFDIVRDFFCNPSENFEIWSILWRHYTPFLVENWPNFAGLWKRQFLLKMQMENTKRRKMRSSTRWPSRFF